MTVVGWARGSTWRNAALKMEDEGQRLAAGAGAQWPRTGARWGLGVISGLIFCGLLVGLRGQDDGVGAGRSALLSPSAPSEIAALSSAERAQVCHVPHSRVDLPLLSQR